MMAGPRKTISVLGPEELYQELAEQAEHSSRSMSAYLRQVIKAHLQYLKRVQKP